MSLELFEIGGLVAAALALTAFFHRAVQPRLLRLAQGWLQPAGASGAESTPRSSLERNPLQTRPATRSRLGSPA